MYQPMFEFRFLTQTFYDDYPDPPYHEIERKSLRPYTIVFVDIGSYKFALPLRSHIFHSFAYFTDKQNHCGIDYSKAVYISKMEYIDYTTAPHIRQDEFNRLRGKEYIVYRNFIKYIKSYSEAKRSGDPNKLKDFDYSTLPYFENLINYNDDILKPLGLYDDNIKVVNPV